jgi:capsular polysaccharide biosynthesis protein
LRIKQYWLVLSRRWWLIAIVAAVATASSIGFSYMQTPVYRSEVKLTVSPSRLDYGLTLVIENLLRQYSQQLQTNKIAAAVNENLDLDLSPAKLLGKVKVAAVSEDYMLVMTVDDTDPNRARDIAYTWASEFVNQQQIRMAPIDPRDRIEVDLLDRPKPGELFFPKKRQLAMAAFVLGVLIGGALIFVLDYLDDTIKNGEEVEQYVGLTVLGALPAAHTGGQARADANAPMKLPIESRAEGSR